MQENRREIVLGEIAMKKLVNGLLIATLTLSPVVGFSQSEGGGAQMNSEQVAQKLKTEKAELVDLQGELRKAQRSRNGWVVARLAAGTVSVLAAIPGVIVFTNGIANVAKGQQFMGDPDNGGALMIPVVIVTTAVSAAAGVGAVKAHEQVEMRAQDIARLNKSIEDKLALIAQHESLLGTLN